MKAEFARCRLSHSLAFLTGRCRTLSLRRAGRSQLREASWTERERANRGNPHAQSENYQSAYCRNQMQADARLLGVTWFMIPLSCKSFSRFYKDAPTVPMSTKHNLL